MCRESKSTRRGHKFQRRLVQPRLVASSPRAMLRRGQSDGCMFKRELSDCKFSEEAHGRRQISRNDAAASALILSIPKRVAFLQLSRPTREARRSSKARTTSQSRTNGKQQKRSHTNCRRRFACRTTPQTNTQLVARPAEQQHVESGCWLGLTQNLEAGHVAKLLQQRFVMHRFVMRETS